MLVFNRRTDLDEEFVYYRNGVIMTFKQYRKHTASWWRRLLRLY